jgi:hypothetical protein
LAILTQNAEFYDTADDNIGLEEKRQLISPKMGEHR